MSQSVAGTESNTSILARAIGVVTAPAATFAEVVRSPRPAGILLLVSLVVGLLTALPQFTERGQQHLLEMQRQQITRMGIAISPEMEETLARRAPYLGYQTLVSVFVALPIVSVVIAAFCWALFNIVLGGTATFKQVLGIVTHSQVIRALGVVAAAPIIWMQGLQNMAGPFNLGALAPMLDPASRLAGMLAGLDFFTLWQIVVIGIGLGVLYRRRALGISVGLLLIYVAVVAAVTAAFSAVFPR
ncbi:MAG: YIP1 family protein [Acidobacteria bacterium]|nr:YIP1 family protein [Acidobacteriota bacterium]